MRNLRDLVASSRAGSNACPGADEDGADEDDCPLMWLPMDVLLEGVLSRLGSKDIVRLGATSKRLRTVCNGDGVWRSLADKRGIRFSDAREAVSGYRRCEASGAAQRRDYSDIVRRVEACRSGRYKMCRLQEQYTNIECLHILSPSSDSMPGLPAGDKVLVAGCWQGVLSLWSLKEERCLQVIRGNGEWISTIVEPVYTRSATRPRTSVFASGDTGGNITIFALRNGKATAIRALKQSAAVTALKFINGFLVSISVDATIRVWDSMTGRRCRGPRHGRHGGGRPHTDTIWFLHHVLAPVQAAPAFAPHQNGLDLSEGSSRHAPQFEHESVILCTAGRDGILAIWLLHEHLQDGVRDSVGENANSRGAVVDGVLTNICWQKEHTDAILCVAEPLRRRVGPRDGSGESWVIATGSADSTIGLWQIDVARGKGGGMRRRREGEGGSVGVVPNVRNQLGCTLSKISMLRGHLGGVMAVVIAAWQPNGDDSLESRLYCVSGGVDLTMRLWNVDSGDCLNVIQAHNHPVTKLVVHDRLLFALADSDGLVAFYATPPVASSSQPAHADADGPSSAPLSTGPRSSRFARRIRNAVAFAHTDAGISKAPIGSPKCFQACFTLYDGYSTNYSAALAVARDASFIALGGKTGETFIMNFQ